MLIFDFLNAILLNIPQTYKAQPAFFWLTIIFVAILSIVTLYGSYKNAKQYKFIFARIAYIMIGIIRCLSIYFVAIVLTTADDIYQANPNLFVNKFYIEVIILTLLYAAFTGIVFAINIYKENYEDDEEKEIGDAVIKLVLKAVVVIIFSILVIFTTIENGIQGFGFMVFGKTVGQWIFNIYYGWIASILTMFLIDVIQAPLIFLFGNPINDLKAAFDV